ncbi:MAG: ROK family protein [Ignavibacteriaceae bacterium]|nr:ROK family protein [Ignavibacteriaceae bacterium]
MSKDQIVIGVDIGGTNTNIGIVDFNNNILLENSFLTNPEQGADSFAQSLSRHINKSYSKYKNDSVLEGIGIAAPGANYQNGIIESPANLKWGNVKFIELMKKHFQVPLALINDANAAALGELQFGSAKGMNNFIVLTLGTGLGTGIVVDGHLLYGENGYAGELGHAIIEKNGRQCNCGKQGCLETYVSASGIKRTVLNLLCNSNEPSEFRNMDFESITGKIISELGNNNDPIAVKAYNFTGEILGIALSNLVTFFDPKAIILSGGLVEAGNLLLRPTFTTFERYLLNIYKGKVKIIKSEMMNGKSAVLGAGSFIRENISEGINVI